MPLTAQLRILPKRLIASSLSAAPLRLVSAHPVTDIAAKSNDGQARHVRLRPIWDLMRAPIDVRIRAGLLAGREPGKV